MIRFNRLVIIAFNLIMALVLIGCFEKNTSNASRAFEYWTNEKPTKELNIVNGEYWESSHWSKEYTLYLEMIAPKDWIAGYKHQNNFVEINEREDLPNDAPTWFKPPKGYKVYQGGDFGSTIFEDSATGHLFIYEIQL